MIIKPNFLSGNLPLQEYPRPQFKRESYLNLNGLWDYEITKNNTVIKSGKILVPYAPESELSGVNHQLQKDETLTYKAVFTLPTDFNKGRVLLNIGACDQVSKVYLNGDFIGENHGGYLPFTFDLTNSLKEENVLVVEVTDNADSDVYGRGKQTYKNGGIWYKATSGIWQTVFLESVPKNYISSVRVTPNYNDKTITVKPNLIGEEKTFTVSVFDGETLMTTASGENELVIPVPFAKSWSPESPELYGAVITYGKDSVETYFGMRKFSLVKKGNEVVFALNDKPIFHNGLLDQGYYHQGLYTPKTNQDMYSEVLAVKNLGFNMLRKHIKVEPLLWYYYCDILGVLVWQDMINGGAKYKPLRIALAPFFNLHINDKNYKKMGRSEESRRQYMKEALALQETLYNVVSLCLYTPFNEAWGQFDAVKVTEILRNNDPSRLYDHASGWQDMGAGDVCSRHIYFRKIRLKKDGKRALAVTEFGGYSLAVKGHIFSNKKFGYKIMKDAPALEKAYVKLFETEIIPEIYKNGLCGTVYTELTDIEDEMNGLFTFDRVLKISAETVKEINKKVENAFNDKFNN